MATVLKSRLRKGMLVTANSEIIQIISEFEDADEPNSS